MSPKTFLSIGECMIELAQAGSDLWHMGIAGDTLNTAWYARALLPAEWRVAYFTRLGTDRFSDRIMGFLADNRIDTDYITLDATRGPGLYAISLDQGERSFTYWRGQSAARHLADDEDALVRAIAAAEVVYTSGITFAILAPDRRRVLLRALSQARANGTLTVFDPNLRPRLWESPQIMRDTITEAAGAAALSLPSFEDEAAIFGDPTPEATAARYLAAGSTAVVVKNGGGPIRIASASETETLSGLPLVTPTDTTGAGDSFNGAYLAAILTGATPKQAVRAAHALACRVIRHPGALIPMEQIAPV